MRICPDCGKEVEKNSKFCPSCGLIFFSTLPENTTKPELNQDSPIKEATKTNEQKKVVSGSSQKKCPDCGKELEKNAKACTKCGLIFYTKPAQPIHAAPVGDSSRMKESQHRSYLVLGLLVCGLLLGFYYFLSLVRGPAEKHSLSAPFLLKVVPSNLTEFDLDVGVIKHPSGLAWNKGGFVLGNKDSQSFLRVESDDNKYLAREAIVGNAIPLTWNGTEFVGYRESGMFGSYRKYQFTFHDANSLDSVREYQAPPSIGGLAWDGAGFWAATRNENREDHGILYRLDRNMRLVNKMVSPSSKCSGLAWDGAYLWFLDGTAKKIYVLEVKGVQVRLIGSSSIPLRSASGIAFDGRSIWICDYDQKCLLRLKHDIQALWSGGASPLQNEIHNALASTVNHEASFDTYRGQITGSPNDIDIASFSAHLVSKDLRVSWQIYFGENLFPGLSNKSMHSPSFAKITVAVDGGTLSDPTAKVFNAHAGPMIDNDVPVLSSLGPGTYHVRLFIYLQYIDQDGKGRILSKSIPPLQVIN